MSSSPPDSETARPTEHLKLAALFDLGRQVTSVLDLDALLESIPRLIARVVRFDAFAVYLLDARREELTIAYAVGYPDEARRSLRIKLGHGLVGTAVAERRRFLVNDLAAEPRYLQIVPDMRAAVVIPLFFKGRPVGALNILSREAGCYTEDDTAIVAQFGVHVAVALENARLFERERRDAALFETLAEIGREVASILDLDELLTRIAQLTRRFVDYRTFGILLLNEETRELEMKLALKYGERVELPRVPLGEGLVGYAALHRVAVNVPDVARDPRYIRVVDDVQSELVIPLLLKDRCIGVFDLESQTLDAFDKRQVEVLTLLATHCAVAIENARLYETVRRNEERLEKEVRFAQRVQVALLPSGLPKRLRGIDVAARFAPARELGGDFYDFLSPESHSLVVAVGDVSGKGVPAALYSAFAGELVRSRTFRRRYKPEQGTPAAVLAAMNTILNDRQLEEYYCTLCYASFDLKRRTMTMANSGLPYPLRASAGGCAEVQLPGVPLGLFAGTAYDEVTFPLAAEDRFLFCSDGVFEAADGAGEEFGVRRLMDVILAHAQASAARLVDEVFDAVQAHCGDARPDDDMTAVVVRITT